VSSLLRSPAKFKEGLSREVIEKGKRMLRLLNRVQQKALFKALMAEEYALVQGMPGTGKTTLIVTLVRVLTALGKSVLLTSYTHSAVDNVLVKLKEADGEARFIRLGRLSRVREEVRDRAADALSANVRDSRQLGELFRSFPVVATTCLGLNHPAVTSRSFDYCILDEAGQAPFLAALGPLMHARRFVLVGDPQQLPPVVQSHEARE